MKAEGKKLEILERFKKNEIEGNSQLNPKLLKAKRRKKRPGFGQTVIRDQADVAHEI